MTRSEDSITLRGDRVKNKIAIATIEQAAIKWPAPFVARSKVKEFTGGVYSAGYLANLDSLNHGPEGAFKIGRQTCYPVESVIDWMISRLQV